MDLGPAGHQIDEIGRQRIEQGQPQGQQSAGNAQPLPDQQPDQQKGRHGSGQQQEIFDEGEGIAVGVAQKNVDIGRIAPQHQPGDVPKGQLAHGAEAHIVHQPHLPGGEPDQDQVDAHGQTQDQHPPQTLEDQAPAGPAACQGLQQQRAHQQRRGHGEVALIDAQGAGDGRGSGRNPGPGEADDPVGPQGRQKEAEEVGVGGEHIGEGGRRGREGRQQARGQHAGHGAADAQQRHRQGRGAGQTQQRQQADEPGHAVVAVQPQNQRQQPPARGRAVGGGEEMAHIVVIGQLVGEHKEVGGQAQDQGGGTGQPDIARRPGPEAAQRLVRRGKLMIHGVPLPRRRSRPPGTGAGP